MSMISVIVPVYNVEKYLHRCVDSILAQTFTDFELILVDDGSPDNCGKICDGYAVKDNRVIVIHKENGGVSIARNVGTARARGDYVTYIDADDWITRDYLECLYNAVIAFGADISVTHPIVTGDESAMGIHLGAKIIQMNPREAILRYTEEDSDGIRSPWGKLIKREIAQSVLFPQGRHYAEDAACAYQWYWKAKRIVDIQDKLYFYFYRSDSVCHEDYSPKKLGEYDTLREMISFFAENDFDELYQDYICEYLARSLGTYQYLLANNSQQADQLHEIIQNAMKFYLQSDVGVENYKQLLDYYKKRNSKCLCSFVKVMVRRLGWVIPVHMRMMGNKKMLKSEKRFLQLLLLRYGIQYHFSCEAYPAAYDTAFPHLMKYYWIIRAQIKKLRRK